MKSKLVWTIIGGLACLVAIAGCGKPPAEEEEGGEAETAVKVQVATVEADTLTQTVRLMGTVSPLPNQEAEATVAGAQARLHHAK